MRVLSHNDPNMELLMDRVAPFIQEAKARGFPFWVFLKESNPIGIIMIGIEPIRLLAKPGTNVAIAYLVNPNSSEDEVIEFTREMLALVHKKECEYTLLTLPESFIHYNQLLLDEGFKEYDIAWRMTCNLEQDIEAPQRLEFKQVRREEMREYVKITADFMRGSPDVMLSDALGNFETVSEEFLDVHHSQVVSFFAHLGEHAIGILDMNKKSGLIGSVAVSTSHRGKGFGKDIMLFALLSLKESGCKQAYLRVHINNHKAIRLYEDLGFVKSGKFNTLMWKR